MYSGGRGRGSRGRRRSGPVRDVDPRRWRATRPRARRRRAARPPRASRGSRSSPAPIARSSSGSSNSTPSRRSTCGTRLSANAVSRSSPLSCRHAGAVEVRGSDLRPLEEGDGAVVVGGDVGERGPPREQLRKAGRGAPGCVEEPFEATAVVGEDVRADIAQRGRVLLYQRVVGILAEDAGDLGRPEMGQPVGRPGALLAEALRQAGRDRQVAAVAGTLADRRPPARAEVDRVEADDECGPRLAIALDQVRRRVRWWKLGGRRERRGVCLDLVPGDLHRAGPARDPGAGGANPARDVVCHRDEIMPGMGAGR